MLDELRPRLWKRIALTLILAVMAYSLFEGLTLDSAVTAVGLLTVIYNRLEYETHFSGPYITMGYI
ncbi:MAG: hypothetical protein LBP80_05155 [Treponema sp.]|nr:hypothetical protein [Treponema sp.]